MTTYLVTLTIYLVTPTSYQVTPTKYLVTLTIYLVTLTTYLVTLPTYLVTLTIYLVTLTIYLVTLIKVAAIVNWYGISDVTDLLQGPNLKNYAVMWMGSQPDQVAIAKRVSPLTYVRAGLPSIISIHGDQDAVVPYATVGAAA